MKTMWAAAINNDDEAEVVEVIVLETMRSYQIINENRQYHAWIYGWQNVIAKSDNPHLFETKRKALEALCAFRRRLMEGVADELLRAHKRWAAAAKALEDLRCSGNDA